LDDNDPVYACKQEQEGRSKDPKGQDDIPEDTLCRRHGIGLMAAKVHIRLEDAAVMGYHYLLKCRLRRLRSSKVSTATLSSWVKEMITNQNTMAIPVLPHAQYPLYPVRPAKLP